MAGPSSSVAELIAEGRYLAAAAIEEARGQKLEAEALFARGRDFARAARLAAERQDLLAQLTHLLHGQEIAAATALADRLAPADPTLRTAAAALYEEHHVYREAALLYESSGELAQARRLYERSGSALSLARLDEKAGDLASAQRHYEHALGQLEVTDSAAARTARLGLGRLLLRSSGGNSRQLEDAVRHLQAARQLAQASPDPESDTKTDRDEIHLALAAALSALGYDAVAREVLIDLDRQIEKSRGRAALSEQPLSERVRGYLDGLRTDKDLLLGRYELGELFGTGGTGRVYRAIDVRGRSPSAVAVKLLPTPSAEHPAYKRFVGELEVLRRVAHPHRVEILDFDKQSGVLVLPLYAQSAATLNVPLPLVQLRRLLGEILSGLAAAHALGVLHRGLKPQNILLTETGTAKLSDFGAAYLHELLATQTESALTAFAYAAPEVLAGKPATVSSDLYSLGVIAYLFAAGELPFRGPDFLKQHAESAVPDPRVLRPELPAPLCTLLFRLLEKDPKKRGELVLSEVESLVRGLPVPSAESTKTSDEKTAPAGAASRDAARCEKPEPRSLFLRIGSTPYSDLYLGTDHEAEGRGGGLGRSVVIEEWNRAAIESPAWPQQLAWLRKLAAEAGPGLQRVLGLKLVGESAPRAIYEAPPLPPADRDHAQPSHAGRALSADARGLLLRVLARLHAAGILHGKVAVSIRSGRTDLAAAPDEQPLPMLLVQGAGPLHWHEPPSEQSDRQALLSDAERT